MLHVLMNIRAMRASHDAEKMKECVWLKPKEVCQVAFVEWTDGGRLRHCKFLSMRDDKASEWNEKPDGPRAQE